MADVPVDWTEADFDSWPGIKPVIERHNAVVSELRAALAREAELRGDLKSALSRERTMTETAMDACRKMNEAAEKLTKYRAMKEAAEAEVVRLREAMHTIYCNTEPEAIKHRDYDHLARDICECASAALARKEPTSGN